MDRIEQRFRESPSFEKGAETAKVGIAAGQLGWRTHGKIVSWWPEVADYLRENYNVQFAVAGGCITSFDVAAEAAGYNSVMEAEFDRSFGENIVDETFQRMERRRKKIR